MRRASACSAGKRARPSRLSWARASGRESSGAESRSRAIPSCARLPRARDRSSWRKSTAIPSWARRGVSSKARRSGPCSAGGFPAKAATSTSTRSASASPSASWTSPFSEPPPARSGPRTTRAARPEPLEKNPDRKRRRPVQRILPGAPDATAMVGPTGEILILNAPFCALSGRLESELIGLDYHALLRPTLPEDVLDEPPLPDGSPLARERLRLLTGSGQTIPVEVISMPTPDETAGQASWSTLTLRDRRKENSRAAREKELGKDLAETAHQLETLEANVREAEIMRARFWTAAAHELRTPLAIVQSYLEVVLTDLAAEVPERPTQLLRTASDGLSRLERLIADVLDAAVSGRARATLHLADMDLAEVVRGLSGALSAAAFKRGLRFQVDVPKGLPRVSGDREKIERLLTNLVDHSLRSTPRSDEPVLLVASREGDRTVIRIVVL